MSLAASWGIIFYFFAAGVRSEGSAYRAIPIDGGGAIQCVAVSPHDPNLVLAGVDVAGIARSTDGGRTWAMSFTGLVRKNDYAVADIAFCPSRPKQVYAAVGNTWTGDAEPGADSSLMVSEDAGLSWSRVSGDVSFGGHLTRQRGKILIVDSKDPQHLWAGTTIHGVLETRDGGKTWMKRGPENIGYINVLVCDTERNNRFYLGAGGLGKRQTGLWVSDDAGRTWGRKLDTGIKDIAAGGKGNILAVGENDVHLSRDYGLTWQNHEKGLPKDRKWASCAAGADPFQAGRFLIAAETEEPSPFLHPKIFLLDRPEGQWRAVDQNVNKIFTTYGRPGRDGWHGFPDWFAAGASMVAFHPTVRDKVYLSDWSTVNLSLDGGRTWKACNQGLCATVPHHRAVWDRAEPGHVYLGLVDVGFMEGWIESGGGLKAHSLRDRTPGTHASPAQFVLGGKVVTFVGIAEYSPNNRIYRRVGRGEWTRVFDNGGQGKHRPACNHQIVFAANEKTGELFALLETTGQVVHSTDEGKTWSRYQDSLVTIKNQDEYKVGTITFQGQWRVNVDGIWYQAQTPGKWSVYTGPEVMYSADGSVQYRIKQERPMKNADELLKSTDGGKTWSQIYRYPWCKGTGMAVTSSRDILWVYYNDWEKPGIAVSVNGGKDWKEFPRPPGYSLLGVYPDPQNPVRAVIAINGMGFWLAGPGE
jgi:photosystem II stability/assembly factor-like uncharacterized protein